MPRGSQISHPERCLALPRQTPAGVSPLPATSGAFRKVLVFLFLFAFGLITYRDGLVAIPRMDHDTFMAHRAFSSGGWDWLCKAVSYNRSRLDYLDIAYLYRPLMMAVLLAVNFFRIHETLRPMHGPGESFFPSSGPAKEFCRYRKPGAFF